MKEIFVDATSGNVWTSKTPRKISRTGVDVSIPLSTHSGISKCPIPYSSDSAGTRGDKTRISIEATAPPCGHNVIPEIDDIRQSATPYSRKSNKLETFIDQKFTNIIAAPPIFTEVLCEKLSNSYSRYLYVRCRMKLVADPVNIPAPQLMDLGISDINALNKGASLWTTSTRVGKLMDVAYWRAPDLIL